MQIGPAGPGAAAGAMNDDGAGGGRDIIGVILGRQDGMSRAHKQIAHAVLTQPQAFVERPVEELVAWLGVSAPTITRFSRLVGCEGLRDLKLKVMGSMRVGLRYFEPLNPPASLDEAAERIVGRAQQAIAAARRTVDGAAVERAAEIVSRSRRLFIFGSGGVSSWMVAEIHNRLFRLGLHGTVSDDHQMQMMLAATAERVDAVICSSLSGRDRELARAAAIAAGYGAPTVAFTTAGSPLAAAVDVALTVDLPEDADVLRPTALRYAFLVLIDLLAYATALRTERAAQETLRRIKRQLVTFRDEDDSQPLGD